MRPPCKRVAVIGGGFGGAASIKALKEDGIEPVGFEKSSHTGGTWRYRDDAVEGLPSIMWTTIINHSKEMGAISNFPFPEDYPNYMRHHQLLKFFEVFNEKFDIARHITCNREVVNVKKHSDYEETGRWDVTVRNTENGELQSDVFDGVMVCTGHITYPKMAEFEGMEKFRGKTIHTHSLKKVDEFAGERVAVVGIGCSALDAAVEVSNVASQVYLSTRTPSWILPRVGPHGLPMDWCLLRRYNAHIQNILPITWASRQVEKKVLDRKFNHNLYGLKPKYPLLCRDPTVNDGLPSKIISGSVVVKKNVIRFEEDGVVFEGDEDATKVDTVIMATGYIWKVPFLDEGIIETDNNRINLYKCVYPVNLKHPTLAFIGFLLPFGPGFPLGEIQTRWASFMFSNGAELPSRDDMRKDVERRYQENSKRYTPSDKMAIRVDFIPYLDEIASLFGARPNLLKMFFTDYKLFKACFFGPCLPYQYRLEGPHKWEGARDAIMTATTRMRKPLSGKWIRKPNNNIQNSLIRLAVIALLIAFLFSWKETAVKYYLMVIFVPYYMSLRSFSMKYLFVLLWLPFYVPWNGFVSDYCFTLFAPLALASLTSAIL